MIKEAYCSYEVSKLLKENGFNEPCAVKYCTDGRFDRSFYYYKNSEINKDAYNAPTLQMACKWLREVHHYYIQVMLDSWACGGHMGYYVVIQKTDSDFEIMLQDYVDNVFYQTYEEAIEEALVYILKGLM